MNAEQRCKDESIRVADRQKRIGASARLPKTFIIGR